MQQFDVVIVGGGMVGLAAALALAKNDDLRIAVLENKVAPSAPSDEIGIRVSAINHRSMRLLTDLQVWQNLPSERVAYYSDMKVWNKDNLGAVQFSAKDIHQSHIGAIVENDVLRYGLWQQATQTSNISLLENHQISELSYGENEVFVQLNERKPIIAKLVVAADGAHSYMREQANIPLTFWDYDQHAVIATIRCQVSHENCARQVFLPSGPLALLPLADPHQCSIVWSTSPTHAEQLLASDAQTFNQALSAASDGVLGLLILESHRQAFPLRMRFARHFVQDKVVLIGDAAHTIHPLAGQGVNLGFADVTELSACIERAIDQDLAINNSQILRQYERARKAAATDMIAAMEGFKRLFHGNNVILRGIRGLGLALFDKLKPLKNWCMKQAL